MSDSKTFNIGIKTDSSITEDWNGGYKLEVDITAQSDAQDWKLDFKLPYKIRDAYGVDLMDNDNGSYTISSQNERVNLQEGQSIQPIFIVDDEGKEALMPEFDAKDSMMSESMMEQESETSPSNYSSDNTESKSIEQKVSNYSIDANTFITEDWSGGYKLEADITAKSDAQDWKLDFKLPYTIQDAYGVDLIDNGDGSYTISGQNGRVNLQEGQSIQPIFIIEDNGQEALMPEFKLQGAQISTLPEIEEATDTLPPAVLSSNAIEVGFKNHDNNTAYGSNAQSKDWNVNFSSDDMDKYAAISNEEAYSGNQSLKITYPDDTQLNAGAGWKIPDAKEYYLSYQVKFAKNFDFNGKYDWSSGGKLPGLGADDLWSGGMDSDGTKGFTSRPMWREDGRAILYLYHMDKPGQYGEDVLLKGSDGKENYFEPGKWHNITQRVRINDGNQSNGEVDVWMDQEQVLSRDNLQFVTNGQEIDTMFFNTFHGGSGSDWWPENDVNAYFDNFVVSTNAADVGL